MSDEKKRDYTYILINIERVSKHSVTFLGLCEPPAGLEPGQIVPPSPSE